ncbi:TIGR01906 family membrane protein [Rothia nasimurium]|uniref:TIGR01906 family membrane protein n=1 Tax=Rothia nasimurium TaxID=85336 RepID=UPI001F202D77|nr:TIGR01906 family membrane protein [Rothia nasimurium]
MAQNPTNPADAPNGKEWEKLSPAINPAADSLLSARRAEKGLATPAPLGSQEAAPWTSPVPLVDGPVPSDPVDEGTYVPGTLSSPQDDQAPASAASLTGSAGTDSAATDPAATRAGAREEAVADRPRLLGLRRTLLALSVPVVIIMVALRAIASNVFLWLEYHRPGFPADSYGFDTQERLRLGSYGLDYVLNLAPHTFLSEITTGGKAAFLTSEVEHMTDVKRVMLWATVFALVMLVAALFAGRTLRLRAPGVIRSSLFAGAWATLILITGLAVAGVLGWEAFFTRFHEVFFPQGNWQFALDDTLIRLYPPQFWVDAAIAAGSIIILMTILLLAATWPTRYRRALAAKRQAERQELQAKLSASKLN